jgi:hypothetical protein
MSSVKRIPPTHLQLMEMLREHLSFEISRFRLAVSMWERQSDDYLIDAMVRESCLIHMRLLLEFFYPRGRPANSKFKDIFVSDYLPVSKKLPRSLNKLLARPAWLEDYRNQLDWRLAHMTMERLAFNKPHCRAWDPKKQFTHLEDLIVEFLKALPDEMRAEFNPRKQV